MGNQCLCHFKFDHHCAS
ncbi:MAG: DUF3709 domain-containing protein [Streptococcus sp.]